MKNYKKIYEKTLGVSVNSKFWDIHHKDENRKNNSIDNLLALPKKIHHRYHFNKNSLSGLIVTVDLSENPFHNDFIINQIIQLNNCLKDFYTFELLKKSFLDKTSHFFLKRNAYETEWEV